MEALAAENPVEALAAAEVSAEAEASVADLVAAASVEVVLQGDGSFSVSSALLRRTTSD